MERVTAEVAVIGSGPVGLKAALDLAHRGIAVALIESGRERFDAAIQALGDAEIADPDRHAPMALATRRAIGGTGQLWGGRCVPLDPIDFEDRPHVPQARWPIGWADIEPDIADACAFLGCGPAVFEQSWPGEGAADGLVLDRLERWCARPNLAEVHGAALRSAPALRVLSATTVTRIVVDPVAGNVVRLEAHRDGEAVEIVPKVTVVAAGGVETARLLLASRLETPALFGGPDGALGRFYMGHLFGTVSDIVFLRDGEDAAFDFTRDTTGHYVRRRFALTAEAQTAERTLNVTAWPELPPLFDARHRSGILSAAYLALAAPVIGPRLMAEAIRRRKLGPGPVALGPHLRNLVAGLPGAIAFSAGFLKRRYGDPVRLPGFFVRNVARRYAFHLHGEHLPDPSSRITLSKARDAAGMPRAVIDLRFSRADADGVLAAHYALARRIEAAGIARIEPNGPPEERAGLLLAQASDGFHQCGTARMGTDPRSSVTDGEGRVHGVSNLFVAGSALFPTSGQANPTLVAVALVARSCRRIADLLVRA